MAMDMVTRPMATAIPPASITVPAIMRASSITHLAVTADIADTMDRATSGPARSMGDTTERLRLERGSAAANLE